MVKKKLKKITVALIVVLCVIVVLGLNAYFLLLHRYKGKSIVYEWSEEEVFDIKSIATLEKKKGKDFIILNLTDIQLADLEDVFHYKTIHDEISYLVEKVKPDLITLTGDQTWSNENLISLKSLIRWLDGYEIPYAPVFGNHDYGNEFNSAVVSREYASDLYEKGKYCLYKRGPSNLGTLGNYVINITEEGKIVKTLYMLDNGYVDEITDKQAEWFKWNAEGIRKSNGGEYSDGVCFMHKPLPEYVYAYLGYKSSLYTAEGEVKVYCSLYGVNQTGFFNLAKGVGVKDIVCGHQHANNFTITYEGVRLTFAVKTGELSFYYDDGKTNLNGGTVMKIGSTTKIENVFVGSGAFHINGSDNIY